VAADSSGGNLAATVTYALTRGGRPPSFQVLIYPMLDATASSASYDEFAEGYGFSSEKSRWYFDHYLPPGADRRAPRVSPLFDHGLGDVPATPIVTAECDPLRDDGERHAKALRQAAVAVELRRYRGMIHGFFQMTGALEGSRRLHRELGDWMREAATEHSASRSATRPQARSDVRVRPQTPAGNGPVNGRRFLPVAAIASPNGGRGGGIRTADCRSRGRASAPAVAPLALAWRSDRVSPGRARRACP
jgi:hypothetical protein